MTRVWAGVAKPKILFVGEAWGESEELSRKPFAGSAGKELFQCLGEAWPTLAPDLHAQVASQTNYGLIWLGDREQWFEEASIAFTNVFNFRPPGNSLERLCSTKKDLKVQYGKDYVDNYPYAPLVKKKCIPVEIAAPELERLRREIAEANPTLIVALGNTPIWALLGVTNIGAIRGNTTVTQYDGGKFKVIPTYHPASILYNWSQRPVFLADLMKAQREAQFPEIRRPVRKILINPTIEEVEQFELDLLLQANAHMLMTGEPLEVGADTETVIRQIEMISFAPSHDLGIVIPFIDKRKPGRSYWSNIEDEWRAWVAVQNICSSPAIRIVGQNFVYDMQYLAPAKVKLAKCPEDTMLLHHSIYPEMKKGLGFLGSIYTDESSWKLLRKYKPDTEKRDE